MASKSLNSDSLLSEAKTLKSSGDRDGYRHLLTEGLKKFPDKLDVFGGPVFRKELVRDLLLEGLWEQASRHITEEDEKSGWHEILFARAYVGAGIYAEADYWWKKVEGRDPNHPELRLWKHRMKHNIPPNAEIYIPSPFDEIIQRSDHTFRILFDVGANEGQSCTEYAKVFPNAAIHVFEPVPPTFKKLQANVSAIKSIRLHNIALGEADGDVLMELGGTSTMNRVVESTNAQHKIRAEAARLDSFCKKNGINHIDFLKIDTEGHDFSVIKGCGSFIENIDFVQCEASANIYNKFHNSFIDIFSYMTLKGFYLFKIYGQTFEWGGDGGYPILRRFDPVFVNKRVVGALEKVVVA